MSSSPSPIEATVAKVECMDVVTRFFEYYDLRDYPPMYAAMAPDAVWDRRGDKVRKGPELEKAMAGRPASRRGVHLLSNMRAEMTAADRITVRGRMAVMIDEKAALSPPPGKMSLPQSILALYVECQKVGDEWKIALLRNEYLFQQ